jgi:hypothetical protein
VFVLPRPNRAAHREPPGRKVRVFRAALTGSQPQGNPDPEGLFISKRKYKEVRE